MAGEGDGEEEGGSELAEQIMKLFLALLGDGSHARRAAVAGLQWHGRRRLVRRLGPADSNHLILHCAESSQLFQQLPVPQSGRTPTLNSSFRNVLCSGPKLEGDRCRRAGRAGAGVLRPRRGVLRQRRGPRRTSKSNTSRQVTCSLCCRICW